MGIKGLSIIGGIIATIAVMVVIVWAIGNFA